MLMPKGRSQKGVSPATKGSQEVLGLPTGAPIEIDGATKLFFSRAVGQDGGITNAKVDPEEGRVFRGATSRRSKTSEKLP